MGTSPVAAAAGRVLRRALEFGVNFIDTANSYGPDVNERLIAEFLHPYPAGVVIATKGGLVRPGPGRWEPDGRPEQLRAACEWSASISTSCTRPIVAVCRWTIPLAHSPVMLPIPGTSSITHLEENVAAATIRLSDGELARLDALGG
ncbi:MAG: hypothetical protein E4H19_07290 [Chromatiales bacterium]|nr:MAG: hypothetical protein E4H19_07290 [Chromatiales bacterium]